MSFQRKFKKLIRDPKLFFKDMYFKKSTQLKQQMPIKYQGKHSFTIVTAVYNVEKYLDEFFHSIITQSLNFKEHIQIICVDDGSKDHSADIIRKYQKKYPNNIYYYYKENGGQASARNLGLQYVKTEWVTFIDPDDFLDKKYFETVDKHIKCDLSMLVCNFILYMENNKTFKDSHPLKYRFNKDETIVDINNMGKYINLSAAVSFFRTESILSKKITFNNQIKPNFEDGKFIADYLMYNFKGKASFLKNAIYFYRKRESSNSTLDKSWENPKKYNDILKFGFLPMLESYKKNLGYVPKNIQNTALYDMTWYIVYLLNKPEKINFLTQEQKNNFYTLFKQVFEYIDVETILDFNLAGAWFFHKVGMLGQFKRLNQELQICYIENLDQTKQQILISYFSHYDVLASYCLDNQDTIPTYSKRIKHTFNEETFVYEYRVWLPYKNSAQNLTININNKLSRIALKNKTHTKSFLVKDIIDAFKPNERYEQDNSWLLMDRETKADDNAEHFYRYMQKNHPEQKCYFALNKDSDDWERLQKDGFNLVKFGTLSYENHLKKASAIISSHLEAHINNYFGDNYDFSKRFIFLQHGITKDDLSNWVNTKKNISLFVCATPDEYNSIISKENNYRLFEKEVGLLGFPRHDALINNQKQKQQKQILIMPTWRNYIVGQTIGTGANTRSINEKFMDTTYAKAWQHFLCSNQLYKLAKQYGYKIIFAPHSNIEPYLEYFNLPKHIECWIAKKSIKSIQDLFHESTLMITDYSSVAFEMALLGKTTLYYQFDYEQMFSGSHTYSKGYFEYEKDAFGAVVYNEQDLLTELEFSLKNNGKPIEPYKSRIKNTFPFRDGNNCERVYQAIKALDLPETQTINTDILLNAIKQAAQHKKWDLLIKRSKLMISLEASYTEFAQKMLIKGLFNTHCFIELEQQLAKLKNKELTLYWKAKLAFIRQDWITTKSCLEKLATSSLDVQFMKLRCYIELGYLHNAQKIILALKKQPLSSLENKILNLYQEFLTHSDINAILREFENTFTEDSENSLEELKEYQPQLLLARLFRKERLYDKAHQQLMNFEKHTKNNISCRIEIALLAFSRKNYDKVISQLEKCFGENVQYLSEPCMKAYFTALDKTKQNDKINKLLNIALSAFPNNLFLLEKRIHLGINAKNNQLALQTMLDLFKAHHYIPTENFYLLIKHRIIEKFSDLIKTLTENEEKSYLLGKVAMVCGNWKLAEQQLTLCQLSNTGDLLLMIKIYAECQKEYSHTIHFKQLIGKQLSNGEKNLLKSYSCLKARDWRKLIKTLELSLFTEQEIIHYKPNLLLSRAFRKLGEYQQAHKHLVQYEKKNHGDLVLRTAIARLAFANRNYEKCVTQFQTAFDTQISAFSENSAAEFSLSLVKTSKFNILKSVLPTFIIRFANNELLNLSAMYLAIEEKKWKEVLILSRKFINMNNDVLYPIILANIRLGKFETAYQHHIRPTNEHNYDFWHLIAELAILMEDWGLAKYCYKGMLSIYPEQNREQNLVRLLQLSNY